MQTEPTEGLRSALIGYSGFVGRNLADQYYFTELYRSSNIELLRNQTFDIIVCCGCPGVKWLANKQPDQDWANISKLGDILRTITVRHAFVLISTIDVYIDPSKGDDESSIDVHGTSIPTTTSTTSTIQRTCSANSLPEAPGRTLPTLPDPTEPYGLHRLRFERLVASLFPSTSLIVRLPALVGPHLKKNLIYDLAHGNIGPWINLDTTFQFYPIRRLWNDILTVLRHNELISQRNQHRSDNIDGKTYVTNCNDTTNQSNTSIATTAGINGLLSSETHSSSDHPTPCPSSLSTPSSAQSTHLSSIPLLTPSSHRIQVINLFPEPVHSKQWIEQVFGQDYLHKYEPHYKFISPYGMNLQLQDRLSLLRRPQAPTSSTESPTSTPTPPAPSLQMASYNLTTKYAALFQSTNQVRDITHTSPDSSSSSPSPSDRYMMGRDEVIAAINEYIKTQQIADETTQVRQSLRDTYKRAGTPTSSVSSLREESKDNKALPSRSRPLSISSIGFKGIPDSSFLASLYQHGVDAIEVAPTTILPDWKSLVSSLPIPPPSYRHLLSLTPSPPSNTSPSTSQKPLSYSTSSSPPLLNTHSDLYSYRHLIQSHHLYISGLQSLLFNCPDDVTNLFTYTPDSSPTTTTTDTAGTDTNTSTTPVTSLSTPSPSSSLTPLPLSSIYAPFIQHMMNVCKIARYLSPLHTIRCPCPSNRHPDNNVNASELREQSHQQLHPQDQQHIKQREGLTNTVSCHCLLVPSLPSFDPHRPITLVFGSPRLRRLPKGMTLSSAHQHFASLLKIVGDHASTQGVVIGLEPNPPQYGCEIGTTAEEAALLVKLTDSPGVMLHLDTGCLTLSGDINYSSPSVPFSMNLTSTAPSVPPPPPNAHNSSSMDPKTHHDTPILSLLQRLTSIAPICSIHISEPFLKPIPCTTTSSTDIPLVPHQSFAAAFNSLLPTTHLGIEMLPPSSSTPTTITTNDSPTSSSSSSCPSTLSSQDLLLDSVDFVRDIYYS